MDVLVPWVFWACVLLLSDDFISGKVLFVDDLTVSAIFVLPGTDCARLAENIFF